MGAGIVVVQKHFTCCSSTTHQAPGTTDSFTSKLQHAFTVRHFSDPMLANVWCYADCQLVLYSVEQLILKYDIFFPLISDFLCYNSVDLFFNFDTWRFLENGSCPRNVKWGSWNAACRGNKQTYARTWKLPFSARGSLKDKWRKTQVRCVCNKTAQILWNCKSFG